VSARRILFAALASGSNGNCTYVESGTTAVLVDCGISGVQLQRRLEAIGRHVSRVKAVLVSHNHRDHTKGIGVIARRWRIPVFATRTTFRSIRKLVGDIPQVRHFSAGSDFAVDDLRVRSIRSPHDGADPVVFVFERGRKRLGVLTDLGFPFQALKEALGRLDGAIVESNHDPDMLRWGP